MAKPVKLNLVVPKGWGVLSDKKLMSLFRMMSMGFDQSEVKLLALLKFSGCKVIGRVPALNKRGAKDWLIRQGKNFYCVSSLQLAEVLGFLNWMDELPDLPVRVWKWKGRVALDPLLQGVPFEKFIIMENLYQGYLSNQNDGFLDQIADVLYSKGKGLRRFNKPKEDSLNLSAFRLNVFYWVASIKKYFSIVFPDFFQPVADSSSNLLGSSNSLGKQLQDSMNAQIRALTKGDITKEEHILSLDTWRALTELNAQAKEYAELNSKISK